MLRSLAGTGGPVDVKIEQFDAPNHTAYTKRTRRPGLKPDVSDMGARRLALSQANCLRLPGDVSFSVTVASYKRFFELESFCVDRVLATAPNALATYVPADLSHLAGETAASRTEARRMISLARGPPRPDTVDPSNHVVPAAQELTLAMEQAASAEPPDIGEGYDRVAFYCARAVGSQAVVDALKPQVHELQESLRPPAPLSAEATVGHPQFVAHVAGLKVEEQNRCGRLANAIRMASMNSSAVVNVFSSLMAGRGANGGATVHGSIDDGASGSSGSDDLAELDGDVVADASVMQLQCVAPHLSAGDALSATDLCDQILVKSVAEGVPARVLAAMPSAVDIVQQIAARHSLGDFRMPQAWATALDTCGFDVADEITWVLYSDENPAIHSVVHRFQCVGAFAGVGQAAVYDPEFNLDVFFYIAAYAAAMEQFSAERGDTGKMAALMRARTAVSRLWVDGDEYVIGLPNQFPSVSDEDIDLLAKYFVSPEIIEVGMLYTLISRKRSGHTASMANGLNVFSKLCGSFGIPPEAYGLRYDPAAFMSLVLYHAAKPISFRLMFAMARRMISRGEIGNAVVVRLASDGPGLSAVCNIMRMIAQLEQAQYFVVVSQQAELARIKAAFDRIMSAGVAVLPYSMFLYGVPCVDMTATISVVKGAAVYAAAVAETIPAATMAMSAALRTAMDQAGANDLVVSMRVTTYLRLYRAYLVRDIRQVMDLPQNTQLAPAGPLRIEGGL